MAGRPLFAFLSLFLIAGAIVLIFFTLLPGAVDQSPLDQIFFLQADTSGIPGAPALSRWTFWNICSVNPGSKNVCPGVHPAFPLDPPSGRNFGTTKDIPQGFLGTRKFFYETRFMFAFVLISLFFSVFSLFFGIFALCSRIGSFLSSGLCFIALFFQTATAALMTAAYVQGRNYFRANNQTASVGTKAFGFIWGAMGALLLATILFCIGGATGRKDKSTYSSRTNGRSFFGRNKSTTNRNRGSFIDNETTLKRQSSYTRHAV
ncbi:hypothetical protein MMC25_005788 [Agyrium rufum]|nr:hypothetical protein [Agyrium rufum]